MTYIAILARSVPKFWKASLYTQKCSKICTFTLDEKKSPLPPLHFLEKWQAPHTLLAAKSAGAPHHTCREVEVGERTFQFRVAHP